jgi:membrane protein
VLLGRRLPWRLLLPQAALSADAISSSSDQFGTIGLAFTLVSWLFAAALVLSAAAAVGATVARSPR